MTNEMKKFFENNEEALKMAQNLYRIGNHEQITFAEVLKLVYDKYDEYYNKYNK
jgi:hypothetical protein